MPGYSSGSSCSLDVSLAVAKKIVAAAVLSTKFVFGTLRLPLSDPERVAWLLNILFHDCVIISRRGFISMRREFPEIFELAAKMDVMAKLAR